MANISRWLRISRVCVLAAIGLMAVTTPARVMAQAGPAVINSFNGTGMTLRAYINGILRQNKLADGVRESQEAAQGPVAGAGEGVH